MDEGIRIQVIEDEHGGTVTVIDGKNRFMTLDKRHYIWDEQEKLWVQEWHSAKRQSEELKWPIRYNLIQAGLLQAQLYNSLYPPSVSLEGAEKHVKDFMSGKVVWKWNTENEQIEETNR